VRCSDAYEQAALIASRLFVAYLLFWVIDDITLLPNEILSIVHYMRATGSVLGTNTSMPQSSYFLRGDVIALLDNILHITLWLIAAGWFYRCGPRIRSFFVGVDELTPTHSRNPETPPAVQ
jgi:hypothetical protein